MAEIKIEKKKPIWPWILVVLIILAVIAFFWFNNNQKLNGEDLLVIDNDTIIQSDNHRINNNIDIDSITLYTGMYGTVRKEQSIADYLRFVDNNDRTATNDQYYRTAFFKLITVVKRESEINNVDVESNIAAAMKDAEKLTNDPEITKTADNIREAAQEVSKALKTIQQKSFNTLSSEADAVSTAANNIQSKGETAQQQTNIDVFFDKAAVMLQKMYENENKR